MMPDGRIFPAFWRNSGKNADGRKYPEIKQAAKLAMNSVSTPVDTSKHKDKRNTEIQPLHKIAGSRDNAKNDIPDMNFII